jgi:hypothetical protein
VLDFMLSDAPLTRSFRSPAAKACARKSQRSIWVSLQISPLNYFTISLQGLPFRLAPAEGIIAASRSLQGFVPVTKNPVLNEEVANRPPAGAVDEGAVPDRDLFHGGGACGGAEQHWAERTGESDAEVTLAPGPLSGCREGPTHCVSKILTRLGRTSDYN